MAVAGLYDCASRRTLSSPRGRDLRSGTAVGGEDAVIAREVHTRPGFSTGSIRLTFDFGTTAVGAFIADDSPLSGFTIELFDSAMSSLGLFTSDPRNLTLDDSFIGITSNIEFYAATFSAVDPADSWGLDDFQYVSTVPVPAAVWLFGSGLLGLFGLARKKTA